MRRCNGGKDQIMLPATMTNEQIFFIDIVNAIPDQSYWSFQCYDKEVFAALNGIPLIDEQATIGLSFSYDLREQITELAANDLYERINFLEIFKDGCKLLEAFDGFVIVTISKNFPLVGTKLFHYLNQDLLFVSETW